MNIYPFTLVEVKLFEYRFFRLLSSSCIIYIFQALFFPHHLPKQEILFLLFSDAEISSSPLMKCEDSDKIQ